MFSFLPSFTDVLLFLATNMVAMAVVAAIAFGGIITAAVILQPPLSWVARYVGIFFMLLLGMQIGYRFSDDRNAAQSALATQREENERLTRDLNIQKNVAADALSRRDTLAKQLEERNQEVSNYEKRLEKALAEAEPATVAKPSGKPKNCSCAVSDDTRSTVKRLHNPFVRR